MIVYAFVAGILLGILLSLGAGYLAERHEKRHREHVLGNIKDKLKQSGKLNRFGSKRGKKTNNQ